MNLELLKKDEKLEKSLRKELDELIQLIENQIPANPRSQKSQSLSKRLGNLFADYFKSLERAFPYHKLEELYYTWVKISESQPPKIIGILQSDRTKKFRKEFDEVFDPVLYTFDNVISSEVNNLLVETYLNGQAEMVDWGQTMGGVPIAYEGPPVQGAIDWANKHGAELVTKMNTETKRRLADTIMQGIDEKRGVPKLARQIRKSFDDMTKYRSQLIARTETNFALSASSLNTMKEMGVEGKQWVTAGDDRVSDECLGNAAEKIIPVNQVFSSGVSTPPNHPDCRCTLAPALLKPKKTGKSKELETPGSIKKPSGEVTSINFNPYLTKSGKNIGGNFYFKDKAGKEIGHASAAFHHKPTRYLLSGEVPANTMVIDSIELYSEAQRGKGLGTKFYNHIEKQAREAGMTQAWATSVMVEAQQFWTKMGYSYSGKQSIWIKKLK